MVKNEHSPQQLSKKTFPPSKTMENNTRSKSPKFKISTKQKFDVYTYDIFISEQNCKVSESTFIYKKNIIELNKIFHLQILPKGFLTSTRSETSLPRYLGTKAPPIPGVRLLQKFDLELSVSIGFQRGVRFHRCLEPTFYFNGATFRRAESRNSLLISSYNVYTWSPFLTSIFEGQSLKTRPKFQPKQGYRVTSDMNRLQRYRYYT